MIVPAHAELHYRARLVFEEPDLDGAEALKTTADALRAWCSGIFLAAGRELAVEAFRAGRTKLVSLAPPGEVRTLVPPSGSVGPVAMPAWALQARVPDPDIRHRQWAHEVAAGPIGERGWRVSVRVHHWLDVGEVGWRAPAPAAGPPGYLIPLADALGPTPTDGYAPLSRDPVPVDLGDGPALVRRLADPDRRTCVVYLSATRPAGRPVVDPSSIARVVALAGSVHVATSPELDEELDHLLPADLRCYGGALRIYRPGLDPRARTRREAERHRYIPRARLADHALQVLLREIAADVARGLREEPPDREPVSFDEIEAAVREEELGRLREEATELRRRSRGGLSARDAERLFELNERLEARLKAVEADNARLATRAFRAGERLEVYESGNDRGTATAAATSTHDIRALEEALRELPGSPADALELAALLFPDRLEITPEARRAARDAATGLVDIAWRLLVAMATELHPLHFGAGSAERSPANIRRAFRDRTRFDVAFTESKSTKASGRLRSIRRIEVEGEELEMLWHVKWGARPPKLLRAYYHPHAERRRLVIGSFGDHLETAGTRRM